MSNSKKFNYRVIEIDKSWSTEIIRRVTSKKFHVSKSKAGFTSELEAEQWGKQEVEQFVKNLNAKNKRSSDH